MDLLGISDAKSCFYSAEPRVANLTLDHNIHGPKDGPEPSSILKFKK